MAVSQCWSGSFPRFEVNICLDWIGNLSMLERKFVKIGIEVSQCWNGGFPRFKYNQKVGRFLKIEVEVCQGWSGSLSKLK